MLKILKFIW